MENRKRKYHYYQIGFRHWGGNEQQLIFIFINWMIPRQSQAQLQRLTLRALRRELLWLDKRWGRSWAERQTSEPLSQSTLYQAEYRFIETEIYNCLSNNYASKALLEWTFLYQTDTATSAVSSIT